MNALYLSLIFFVKPIFLNCKLDAVSLLMFHSVSCIADTVCECGTSEQTMQHLLRCPLLENECSLEDLVTANEKALHCARAWPNIWPSSGMMDTKEDVSFMNKSELNWTKLNQLRYFLWHNDLYLLLSSDGTSYEMPHLFSFPSERTSKSLGLAIDSVLGNSKHIANEFLLKKQPQSENFSNETSHVIFIVTLQEIPITVKLSFVTNVRHLLLWQLLQW